MDPELVEHQLKEEQRLSEIENTIKSLDEKVHNLNANVEDLVTAWKAASWLVSAVKWLGGIALAITALYNFKGPH